MGESFLKKFQATERSRLVERTSDNMSYVAYRQKLLRPFWVCMIALVLALNSATSGQCQNNQHSLPKNEKAVASKRKQLAQRITEIQLVDHNLFTGQVTRIYRVTEDLYPDFFARIDCNRDGITTEKEYHVVERALQRAVTLDLHGVEPAVRRFRPFPSECNGWHSESERDAALFPSRLNSRNEMPTRNYRPEKPKRNFYGTIEAGGQSLFWAPSSNAEPKYKNFLGESITLPASISYKTEGLQSYYAHTTFGFDGEDIASLSYEAPFQKSTKQDDMLQQSSSQRGGIEGFTGILGLNPLLRLIMPETMQNKLVSGILSIQVLYSHRLFYGKATAENAFIYVPPGTPVDIARKIIYGGTIMQAGDTLSFTTNFTEFETSWHLYTWRNTDNELRMGYFESNWAKPSQATPRFVVRDGLVTYPVICDTEFTSTGLSLRIQSKDETAEGLKFNTAFLLGLNNKLELIIPSTNSTSNYTNFQLEGWYNYYIGEDKQGILITLGALFDTKQWHIEETDADEVERLYKVYLKAGYRF